VVYKKSSSQLILGSFSIQKIWPPCSYSAPFVLPNLKAHPLNLIYTSLLPWPLSWPWPTKDSMYIPCTKSHVPTFWWCLS
jgi:hypothetical protein